MNKFFKIVLAILGGINTAFSMVIPMFISLLIISMYPQLGSLNQQIIILAGFLSSLYRAIAMWN